MFVIQEKCITLHKLLTNYTRMGIIHQLIILMSRFIVVGSLRNLKKETYERLGLPLTIEDEIRNQMNSNFQFERIFS